MKKIGFRCLVLLIVLSMFWLSSCSRKYTYEQACEEFSQYGFANDVILVESSKVCIRNREICLEELFPDQEVWGLEAALVNGQFYFVVAHRKNDQKVMTLYSCELRGKNPQVVFEKTDCIEGEMATIVADTVYYSALNGGGEYEIKYFYNITTGYYGNGSELRVSSLKTLIEDQKKYQIEMTKNAFIVTDKTTQETRVIDDAFLQTTEYYKSLKKFEYKLLGYDNIDNVVLLSYSIKVKEIEAILPLSEPMVVFEYDFEKNQLKFQLIGNPSILDGGWTVRHNVVNE